MFADPRGRKKGMCMNWLLVSGLHNRSTQCPSFNFVGHTEKCDKTLDVLEFERKKNKEIKE